MKCPYCESTKLTEVRPRLLVGRRMNCNGCLRQFTADVPADSTGNQASGPPSESAHRKRKR